MDLEAKGYIFADGKIQWFARNTYFTPSDRISS